MGDWLNDLDATQRRVLAGIVALVVAAGLVLGVAAVTGGEDDQPVRTADGQVSTSTTVRRSSTTSTSSTTTSTVDPASITTTSVTAAPPTTEASTATTRRPTTATTQAPRRTTTTQPAPPPPPPPPPTAACNPGGGTAAANDIANRFCAYRADQGLPAVTRNASLDRAAAEWAQKMANDGQLSHRPNAEVAAIVRAACCGTYGENVGFNSEGPAAVWQGWLASSPHLANIRVARTGEYGVGAVTQGGATWIVHMFGWR